jgi:hypothetical protein
MNASLVLLPNTFKSFSYNFCGPSDYWSAEAFRISHSLNPYAKISIFYFQPPFALLSYLRVLLHLQICKSHIYYF